jgi:hypothetical protein
MADLYIVTVEHDQDGMFWDDPEGCDSLQEARLIALRKRPPPGHIAAIYSCNFIEAAPRSDDPVSTQKEPS